MWYVPFEHIQCDTPICDVCTFFELVVRITIKPYDEPQLLRVILCPESNRTEYNQLIYTQLKTHIFGINVDISDDPTIPESAPRIPMNVPPCNPSINQLPAPFITVGPLPTDFFFHPNPFVAWHRCSPSPTTITKRRFGEWILHGTKISTEGGRGSKQLGVIKDCAGSRIGHRACCVDELLPEIHWRNVVVGRL